MYVKYGYLNIYTYYCVGKEIYTAISIELFSLVLDASLYNTSDLALLRFRASLSAIYLLLIPNPKVPKITCNQNYAFYF